MESIDTVIDLGDDKGSWPDIPYQFFLETANVKCHNGSCWHLGRNLRQGSCQQCQVADQLASHKEGKTKSVFWTCSSPSLLFSKHVHDDIV
jgi:hypothetical protein